MGVGGQKVGSLNESWPLVDSQLVFRRRRRYSTSVRNVEIKAIVTSSLFKAERNWIKSSLRSFSNLGETFCSHFWLALCLSSVLNHNYSGELLLFLLVPFVFVSASVSLSLMFHQNSSIWFIFNGFACLTFRAVAGIGICRRDIYRKLLHYYSWLAATGRISIW